MPIENERKFVLDDISGALEARLASSPGVTRGFLRQGYLEASGLRIRSIEGAAGTRYIFSFKREVDGQMVEIETDISKLDFDRLWKTRRETLQKARYSWPDGPFHWDIDFFKTEEGATYFALAEVEMPEDAMTPPPPPADLAPHVLLLAPLGDPRFTSKRLADQNHAERLLAETRHKGKAP
jgi:CYTH domain-containing protein